MTTSVNVIEPSRVTLQQLEIRGLRRLNTVAFECEFCLPVTVLSHCGKTGDMGFLRGLRGPLAATKKYSHVLIREEGEWHGH